MTTHQSADDFTRRRHQRTDVTGTADHRTRLDYDTFAAALVDAVLVVDDLKQFGEEQLLVPFDEIAFTVRRLRALLGGAIATAREEGIQ